jgi:putative transposase
LTVPGLAEYYFFFLIGVPRLYFQTSYSYKGVFMSRKARVVVPNCPHHLIQRGHNRSVLFVEKEDYQRYLSELFRLKDKFECRVSTYTLMTNHTHLIVNPGSDPTRLGKLMRDLSSSYSRYINRRERRRSSIWDGRFKSSPIQSERYLLACSRYIELNPVRAQLVAKPEDYVWSSYRAKLGLEVSDDLDFDDFYQELGPSKYQEWMNLSIPKHEWNLIRRAVQLCQSTGNKLFTEEIKRRIDNRI